MGRERQVTDGRSIDRRIRIFKYRSDLYPLRAVCVSILWKKKEDGNRGDDGDGY